MTAVLERGDTGVSASVSRRWNDPAVLVALAVVVLAALWLGTLARSGSPGDDSAEAGFARDMAVHHGQAVAMAELVRFRTEDPAVRVLATDIALTQQAQIGQVRGWLEMWGLPVTGRRPAMAWMDQPTNGPMPGMATPAQVRAIGAAPPAEADVLFLQAMIPHHRAAIAMAEAVLDRTDRREVRRLAQGIVAAQASEIAGMEDLLRRKGAPTPAGAAPPPHAAGGTGHDGFLSGITPAARSTLRLAPLAAGVVALAWLASDDARRRRRRAGAAPGAGRWPWVAGAGLALAGILHLGLAPAHFDEAFAYGAFFAGAAVVQLALAPAVVALPSKWTATAAGLTAGVLTIVYLAYRLVAPPGATEPETVDAVGLGVQILQLAAIAAGVAMVRQPRRDPSGDRKRVPRRRPPAEGVRP